jgi:hypothetical protein
LLDQQRTELLAAMSSLVAAERGLTLAALSEERKAALETIRQERAAAQAAVDALVERSMEGAYDRARSMADYAFVRALILLVTSAVIGAVALRFAMGRAGRGGASG